jgi:serine/threonine protein kinase
VIHSGEVLDGYRAIRRIGAGGFGEVWLARNEAFGDFRALKFIPASDKARLNREHAALCKYREESARLLNKALMPIEHANLRADGMFYVMPLADGTGSDDPAAEQWRPLSLASLLKERADAPTWFSSWEVKAFMTPVLKALQMLDDARLVHRDVKPENILFRNGSACLSDISLLNNDLTELSRSGTHGYCAPKWYLEAGGHPDMYGVAATLFILLTGKSPDKMAQSRHRWPPQGEESLAESERQEWRDMHRLITRATDDDADRRFLSFSEFDRTLNQHNPVQVPEPVLIKIRRLERELEVARLKLKEQRNEIEGILDSTVNALEKASHRTLNLSAGAGDELADVAKRFAAGLTAARPGAAGLEALGLTKRAMRAIKEAREAHGPAVGWGIEELRVGLERILQTDREFLIDRVREVLAKAHSILESGPGIGSLATPDAAAKLAGLFGVGPLRGALDVVRLIGPAVLSKAHSLLGLGSPILRIIESAQDFLTEQKNEQHGPSERSAKN